MDREHLGKRVREVWIAWAKTQPHPKQSWLVPWDELAEPDREVDRMIGETLARESLAQSALLYDAAKAMVHCGMSPDIRNVTNDITPAAAMRAAFSDSEKETIVVLMRRIEASYARAALASKETE